MVAKRKEMFLICCKRSKKVQLESLFKNSFFQLLINLKMFFLELISFSY